MSNTTRKDMKRERITHKGYKIKNLFHIFGYYNIDSNYI